MKPRSSSVPGTVLSSTVAMSAPTAIPVPPRVFRMFASHSASRTSGFAAKYSGTESPMKNENPTMKRLRALLRSTNCRFESPTLAIMPNMAQYIPPTIGWGIVVKSAPNLPITPSPSMRSAPT